MSTMWEAGSSHFGTSVALIITSVWRDTQSGRSESEDKSYQRRMQHSKNKVYDITKVYLTRKC